MLFMIIYLWTGTRTLSDRWRRPRTTATQNIFRQPAAPAITAQTTPAVTAQTTPAVTAQTTPAVTAQTASAVIAQTTPAVTAQTAPIYHFLNYP